MATITRNGKSNSYYIQWSVQGRRRKLYGFPNRHTAARMGEKLEELTACVNMGVLSPEVKTWLRHLLKIASKVKNEGFLLSSKAT